MKHRAGIPEKERRKRSRLAQIVHDKPLLKGGLVTMARTCGKKGCKCNQGDKHVSLYLSAKVDKKPKMIFIPSALEKQVRAWVQNYKAATSIIEEISTAHVEKVLAMKEKSKSGKKRVSR